MSRQVIAIDFGRRRLRAVLAGRSGERLAVRKVLTEPVPEDLGHDDALALGEWARRALERAGFPRGGATVAISREHVALKRLTLPTTDDRELPAMTRLAVRRDLPFDADEAVIDYAVLGRSDSATAVLAVAVPGPVLEFARRVARQAGLDVERVSLRAMGAAALVHSLDGAAGTADAAAGILVVDITAEGVEFSVVVGGRVRFSRAGDLPAAADPEALAEAVITETRRTWMSYRIVEDSQEVCGAVVIGEGDVAPRVAGSIDDVLKVPARVLARHPLVDPSAADMDGTWPLAGLLLEPGLGVGTIDLVKPKRAPDTASRRRQLALGVGGAVMVLLAAAITGARLQLDGLASELAGLKDRLAARVPDYVRYKRDVFKLQHLEHWERADAGWLAHLERLVEPAPEAGRLVLDSWTATLDFPGVKFDRRSKVFAAPLELRLSVEGEAADRATADAYRGALVETDAYAISTTGPDAKGGKRLPFGFSYALAAGEPAPKRAVEPAPAPGRAETP